MVRRLGLAHANLAVGPATILPPAQSAAMVVDAHKNDGKRYIVQSDELFSAFLELEATLLEPARYSCGSLRLSLTVWPDFAEKSASRRESGSGRDVLLPAAT